MLIDDPLAICACIHTFPLPPHMWICTHTHICVYVPWKKRLILNRKGNFFASKYFNLFSHSRLAALEVYTLLSISYRLIDRHFSVNSFYSILYTHTAAALHGTMMDQFGKKQSLTLLLPRKFDSFFASSHLVVNKKAPYFHLLNDAFFLPFTHIRTMSFDYEHSKASSFCFAAMMIIADIPWLRMSADIFFMALHSWYFLACVINAAPDWYDLVRGCQSTPEKGPREMKMRSEMHDYGWR